MNESIIESRLSLIMAYNMFIWYFGFWLSY